MREQWETLREWSFIDLFINLEIIIQPKRIEQNRTQSNWTKRNPIETNRTEPNLIKPNITEPNWTKPNPIEPNRTQSNWTEPNPIEPNRIELNPIKPNRTEPKPTQHNFFFLHGGKIRTETQGSFVFPGLQPTKKLSNPSSRAPNCRKALHRHEGSHL